MARFITTTEISWQIEKIINEAKRAVIIVSPYLKMHSRLEKLIEKQLSSQVQFFFIYREKDLNNQTKNWFDNKISKYKDKISLINIPNLHAKCYINKSNALITSMNLHEYSMVNNIEYGMFINIEDDRENYELIKNNLCELCDNRTRLMYRRLHLSMLDV